MSVDRTEGDLWKKVEANKRFIYLAVEKGDMPYIEPPLPLDPDEVPADNSLEISEATLNVFVTLESAEQYVKYLEEHQEPKPEGLKLIKITLEDLWSLLDELSIVASENYAAPLSILLIETNPEEVEFGASVIYSQTELYN